MHFLHATCMGTYYGMIGVLLSCLVFVVHVGGVVSISGQDMLPGWKSNRTSFGRDAGISSKLWGRILWMFGDTFVDKAQFVASCTVGWAFDEQRPWIIEEEKPWQFFPFTAQESAFNRRHFQHPTQCCLNSTNCGSKPYCHCPVGTDCVQRYAIWPGDAFEYNDTHALVLYGELFTGWAPFDFRPIGVGVAWILRQKPNVAQRIFVADQDVPLFLWNATEPIFTEGIQWGAYVYLYANVNGSFCTTDTLLARAPLNMMMNRSSYTYYVTDGQWSPRLGDAQSIGRFPNALGSVMWSQRYQQFIAFSLGFCSGNSSVFRLAPTPWGPWDVKGGSVVDIIGAGNGSYAGEAHEELQTTDSMIISFLQPNVAVWWKGAIRLVNLTFS